MSQTSPPLDAEIAPFLDDPGVQQWFDEHMSVLRQDAYGQRFLYFTLAGAFVLGLVCYVVGYLLRPSATTEPFGLLADLLYTFGFALWTAAVVVVLLEVIPEVKRRQVRRSLEAYEAYRRQQARQKDTA